MISLFKVNIKKNSHDVRPDQMMSKLVIYQQIFYVIRSYEIRWKKTYGLWKIYFKANFYQMDFMKGNIVSFVLVKVDMKYIFF